MRIGLITRNPRLYSSRRLLQAIRSAGHTAVIVDPFRCVLSVAPLGIRYKHRPLPALDVAIPRVGTLGASVVLAVLRQLSVMGTELLNSPDAIAMARDKWMTLQRLVEHGIPVPPTLFSVDAPQLQKNLPKLGTPVVFKVLDGLQGAGVVVAESHRSAASMMDLFQSARTDFIAQTFIAESESADIRCLVLNGQVIAAMRRQGRADDFRSNLHRGGSATSIELTAEESHIAVAAADAIGLRLAGVDILRSKAGSLVIEVNASPGLEGIEGISLETIAEQIISTAVAIATI